MTKEQKKYIYKAGRTPPWEKGIGKSTHAATPGAKKGATTADEVQKTEKGQNTPPASAKAPETEAQNDSLPALPKAEEDGTAPSSRPVSRLRLTFESPQNAPVIRIKLPIDENELRHPPTAESAAHKKGKVEVIAALHTKVADDVANRDKENKKTRGKSKSQKTTLDNTAATQKTASATAARSIQPISRERVAFHRRKLQKRRVTSRRLAGGILRCLGAVGLILGMALALVFGVITMICKGPFPTANELFVVSVNETSAVKFLSRIYFTQAEVEEILAKNAVVVPEEVTDTTQPFTPAQEADKDRIEIIDVYGSTYKGKMMIVHDPSRIQLATIPAFGTELRGKRVEQFVADSGAVAGINAGGFADEGGTGKGGMPLGLVLQGGQITSGAAGTECNLIGFDQNNRLVVGMMSGQEALDLGVRDAVHFEPTLIVNGNPAEVSGTGGGLNPRTVIGQREDGAVLLLVIDGRQPHSVGATLQDCMQEMLNFSAVNAANLDGGSSSMMVYEGEVINICASLNGSRSQPAAWLVM